MGEHDERTVNLNQNRRPAVPASPVQQMDIAFSAPLRKFEEIQRAALVQRGQFRRHLAAVSQPVYFLRTDGHASVKSGNANDAHNPIEIFLPRGVRALRYDIK